MNFESDTYIESAKKRFFEKVNKQPNNGCWIWNGAIDGTNYGRIWYKGKIIPAHRMSYELFDRIINNRSWAHL